MGALKGTARRLPAQASCKKLLEVICTVSELISPSCSCAFDLTCARWTTNVAVEAAVRRTAPRKTDNTTETPKPTPTPQTNIDRNGTDTGGRAAEERVDSPDDCSSLNGDGTDDDGEIAPGKREGSRRRKRRRVASTRLREATASQTGVMSLDSDSIVNSKHHRDKVSRQNDPPEAKRATATDPPGAKRARAASSVAAYVERHYADLGIPWMVPPERSPSPPKKAEPDSVDSTDCEGGGGARFKGSGPAFFGDTDGNIPTLVGETAVNLTGSDIEDGWKECGMKTVEMEKEAIGQEPSHPVRNSPLADILAGQLIVGHGRPGLVGRGSGSGGGGGGSGGEKGIGALHAPQQSGHRHTYLHEQQHQELRQYTPHETYKQLQQHQRSQREEGRYGTALSQLSPSTLGYVAPAPQLNSPRESYPVSSARSPLPPHSSVQTHNPIPPTARIQEISKPARGAECGNQEQHPARAAVAESDTGETRVYRAPVASTIIEAATTAWNSHEQTPAAAGGESAPPTVGSESHMGYVETGGTQASEAPQATEREGLIHNGQSAPCGGEDPGAGGGPLSL